MNVIFFLIVFQTLSNVLQFTRRYVHKNSTYFEFAQEGENSNIEKMKSIKYTEEDVLLLYVFMNSECLL